MMQRQLLSILFLFLLCASARAFEEQTGYGLLGGIDQASAQFTAAHTTSTLNSRTGLVGEVFADIDLTPDLYIEPGFSLIQKGVSLQTGGAWHLDYVELPVLLMGRVRLGSVNLFLGGGANYGIAINKVYVNSAGQSTSLNSYVNNNELSIPVCAGAEFALDRKWSILVEGRYSWGLTNVLNSNFTQLLPSNYNSRNFIFLAGVSFRDNDAYHTTEDRAIEYLKTHPNDPTN